MKLTFEFRFTKEEGFTEKDFLQIISRDLSQLGYIISMRYQVITEGYLFEIEYRSRIPGITYQPILSCFMGLKNEYPYIGNVSMPIDKMR